MKNFLILVIISFSCTLGAQSTLDIAKEKIVNGKYRKAKNLLQNYIRSERDTNIKAEGYFWLGECAYQKFIKQKPQTAQKQALEFYSKGLEISKKNPYCMVGMGKLLIDKRDVKESLKVFDIAVRNSKGGKYKEGHPDIYMLIGDAYMNCTQPNIEQAIANYTRARDIDPKPKIYWEKLNDPRIQKFRRENTQ